MVQVTVSEGILEGEILDNVLGGKYTSFKGIPFAAPPLGDLRFKAPQPPKPWTGVRSAKEHGPNCIQFDQIISKRAIGSEDCLYLNVYTPSVTPHKPLPVMVWIHGGAFFCGSGDTDMYGADFLVDKEVILVTFNYRLEVLGFLCLDTVDVPGNAGMKDQVAAMRWVKKNIHSFGGDPENITLFGESAGGTSVAFHLISPMSKGLFKRAISQSGAATGFLAHAFEPRQKAINLAREMGKITENDKELYEFFKSQPAEALINKSPNITFAEVATTSFKVHFNIVDEKKFGDDERFFFGDVYNVFKRGIHEDVEVIVGYTADEGLLGFAQQTHGAVIKNANSFLESFVPRPITLKCSIKDQIQVGRKFKKYYCNNNEITLANIENVIKFMGMDLFIYDIIQLAKTCAKLRSNKVYLYKFNCVSERNIFSLFMVPKEVIGNRKVVTHGEDLLYIFNTPKATLDITSKSFKMITNITTLWTNFAKFGEPTTNLSFGAKWLPYTLEKLEYLEIDEVNVLKTAPEGDELEFWESIMKDYLPKACAIRG